MLNMFKKVFADKRFYIFILGGIVIFFLEWALTVFLTEGLGFKYYFSYFIALFFGLILLFIFNQRITFKYSASKKKAYRRFIEIYSILYILNWILVVIFAIKVSYLIAIPVSNLLIFVPKYVLSEKIVFI